MAVDSVLSALDGDNSDGSDPEDDVSEDPDDAMSDDDGVDDSMTLVQYQEETHRKALVKKG